MTPSAGLPADVHDPSAAPGRLGALRGFLSTEAGGAIVLLAATIAAIGWANSPWSETYDELWGIRLSLGLGDWTLVHSLREWTNDGLMAFFFLVIGLEVRREFDMGEFRERRRVAVPVVAAMGGMLLPVVLFLALNSGPAARGWALVMATDTAFAVGVLALVGSRSSLRLRSFLLTLVIVDDVAAVSVIAVAYSSNVRVIALVVAIALLGLMAAARARGADRPSLYWLLGLAIWFTTAEAGVHPTVAGVAIGLLTPAHPPRRADLERATGMTRLFRQRPSPDLAARAARRITQAMSPNERLQHRLHPWTSLAVVPLFALANAGLHLDGELLASALGSSLVVGIILGLVAGKTLGIPIGAWIATRPRLGGSALVVGWPSLVAASSVGGIGFTMSLLIAELSYDGTALEQAKLGIFAASIVAAALSILMFQAIGLLPADLLRRAEARAADPVTDLTVPVDPEVDHTRGPDGAPVTIVVYADFECRACAEVASIVRELVAASDGRARQVFRHLPLTDVHHRAALAAEAAEAAAAQGRFWEMHDRLFAEPGDLSTAALLRPAMALGLDLARFERELESGAHADRVRRDIESAEDAGVAGIPGLFVNGVRLRGALDADSVAAAVRRATAGGAPPGERAPVAGRGAGEPSSRT
ncbi:MAG TPA: Na+/H+ antiporter NhaA [Candidatus Limnocylindrales bacterium]|nr:Na+/H+ antiporter NhaA [Candidatus Limnocylindrales bacterium]